MVELSVMQFKEILISMFISIIACSSADDCLHCICMRESQCKPIGCSMDMGSLSCGYYQMKIEYYEDCGQPGKRPGESMEAAWKRCSDDLSCARTCVQNYYNRYKSQCDGLGMGACQIMARIHKRGPRGCHNPDSLQYWKGVRSCRRGHA